MAQLKDFIVRTRLVNTEENHNKGDSAFDTLDYVFLETYGEAAGFRKYERISYASDYAVMNGALVSREYAGPKKDRRSTWQWLRSADSEYSLYGVGPYGSTLLIGTNEDLNLSAGLCPAMRLNLSSLISDLGAENLKIEPFKDKSDKILYHTIEFGSYPQDKAKNSDELTELYKAHKLTPTGKTYTGYMKDDGSFQQNKEFEYNGKKYVRVISKKHNNGSKYKDGTKAPEGGTPMWAEVQPIKWKILNYNKLPRSINPNGNGTAKTIYVKSEEALMSGILFYAGSRENEYTMWQNSPLRAIFNGYNLHEELSKGNGNIAYKARKNFNFNGKGFLEEAFDGDLKSMIVSTKHVYENKNFHNCRGKDLDAYPNVSKIISIIDDEECPIN